MPISFLCPHCGLDYSVADDQVGSTFPCKKCGQEVEVPAPVSITDEPLGFVEPAAEAPQQVPAPPPHVPPPPQYVPPPPQHAPPPYPYPQYAPHPPQPQYAHPQQPYAPHPPHAHAHPRPRAARRTTGPLQVENHAAEGPYAQLDAEAPPRKPANVKAIVVVGISVLVILGGLATVVALVASAGPADNTYIATEIESDFELIRTRLQAYYVANANSLASGGPAQAPSLKGQAAVVVKVDALVDSRELQYPRQFGRKGSDVYAIHITGPNSARVTCHVNVEIATMEITDIAGGVSTTRMAGS